MIDIDSVSRLCDTIDELVDEQLADGEPLNGFDFGDPDYPRCPHCGRHWHGLPITARIAFMYRMRRYDPEYTHAEDNSPILCDGSNFIGPIRPAPDVRDPVINIRIEPYFEFIVGFGGVARVFQQLQQQFGQLTYSGIGFLGIRPGAPWFQYLTYDEPHQLTECAPTPDDITIEFGPQNWIHEMRRIPPPDRQWPRILVPPIEYEVPPIEYEVAALWPKFTAPNYPIPDRPGYDFSTYADDDPAWAPTADTRARTTPRSAHTTARQRRRGRSHRGG